MDILDDMGASKLSAKVFLKVNYSFKFRCMLKQIMDSVFSRILNGKVQHFVIISSLSSISTPGIVWLSLICFSPHLC